jgi:tight adherence protein C
VNKRVNQRQTEIIQGFPDALDLMLVCVEAGQSLDQSIIRVGKESRVGYPALADEFDMVAQEVKAGKERISVLKDMAERVGVPDVASFVTTIIQSATFGTSVADALRVYSADMRDKRPTCCRRNSPSALCCLQFRPFWSFSSGRPSTAW